VLLNSLEMKYGICQWKYKNWEDGCNFAVLYMISLDVQSGYTLVGAEQ